MLHSFRYTLLGLACLEALFDHALAKKVVQMPFKKRERNTTSSLDKRDPFAISMQNYIPGAEYYVTASVGTPAQDIEFVVDTGSSDIWMFGPNSCNRRTSLCEGGEFDISSSTTAQYVSGGQGAFKIRYVTQGSGVTGDYITDNFGVGGETVNGLTMAVATRATYVPSGIMGIGLAANEAAVSQGVGEYPNFPDLLVSQGKINTKAYSLYLDDIASSTGMIVFGGYDEQKFTGDIKMLPIQRDQFDNNRFDSLTVSWSSLGIQESGGDYTILQDGEFLYPATLDTGTTLTYVPTAIFQGLANYFNVAEGTRGEPAQIDCDFGQKHPGQLVYGFGGPTGAQVAVEFDELAIPYYVNGQRATRGGQPVCAFGIVDAGSNPILLGQTLLRSAYVLYDLENMRVGLAQTVFDSSRSDVVEYTGESGASRVQTVQGPTVTNILGGVAAEVASAVPTDFTLGPVPYPSETLPDTFPTALPVGPTGIVPLNIGNDNQPHNSGSGSNSGGSSSRVESSGGSGGSRTTAAPGSSTSGTGSGSGNGGATSSDGGNGQGSSPSSSPGTGSGTGAGQEGAAGIVSPTLTTAFLSLLTLLALL